MNNISKKNVCSKQCELEEDINYITLIFEEEITSCENMFKHCNIKEINLSNFDTSKVTRMKSMFDHCENLEKITFGNINTSLVKNMYALFHYCSKLTALDLSNFDTSSTITMESMFSGCESLNYLNINNFNTSSVTNMNKMFTNCLSLTSLNLSSFNIQKETNVELMLSQTSKNLIYCINNNSFTKIESQLIKKNVLSKIIIALMVGVQYQKNNSRNRQMRR